MLKIFAAATICAFALCSCVGNSSTAETLDTLAIAIDNGDSTMAENAFDAAVDDVNSREASVNELCRLAMLGMKLDDKFSMSSYSVTALSLYDRATSIDRDSVEAYVMTLDRDDIQYMHQLLNLQRGLENSGADIPDHEEDAMTEIEDHNNDYNDYQSDML